MPDYVYTVNGRSIHVRSDREPSPTELDEIFTQAGIRATPDVPPGLLQASHAPPPPRTWGDTASDLAVGAAKGAGQTVTALGDLARKIPGVSALDALMTPVSFSTEPTNTPQAIGKGSEQIGEFFLPVPGGLPIQIAKNVGLTLAQGGTPTQAAVSGGLTAAVPAVTGIMRALAPGLERGALASERSALGATKEGLKATATKLAPQMLERGVGGSRSAMLKQATEEVARLGPQIGQAIDDATQAGQVVDTTLLRGNLQLIRDALMARPGGGGRLPIPGTEPVLTQLEKMDQFLSTMGPQIAADQAQHIKQAWGQLAASAGLYGAKVGASPVEKGTAWALRAGERAIAKDLQRNPTLARLDQDFAFWKGLKDVLTATQLRTTTSRETLSRLAAKGTASVVGGTIGAVSGETPSERTALGSLGAILGPQFVRVLESPAWQSQVSGPLKHALAQALASGEMERIIRAAGKIVAAVPAQLGTAPAPDQNEPQMVQR